MAFKLLLAAQRTWRKLNGAALLPLVREGAKFLDGRRVERKPPLTKSKKATERRTADQQLRDAA
jgi:hypothetical protein